MNHLFDHLVGKLLKVHRYVKAKGPGGFEIEYQFEFGRCLNRKFGRLGAPQNAIDILSSLQIEVAWIGTIVRQPTVGYERPIRIDRWQPVLGGSSDDQLAIYDVAAVRQRNEAAIWFAGKVIESAFELRGIAVCKTKWLDLEHLRCGFHRLKILASMRL